MSLHPKISHAFNNHQVLKVITGINNYDVKDILLKVQAAEIGGATYVDISANTAIVQEVKQISSIPICVSSIDVDELCECFEAGADILEIGNFDIFYSKGIVFTSKQVEDLTIELKNKVPDATICVTIPHCLHLSEQIILAKKLEKIGVAILQTEGISSKCYSGQYLWHSIYNASAALSSTYVFSKNVNIPILSSSGINSLTAPVAIAYGASGVGIGSFFNSSQTIFNLAADIRAIVASMSRCKDITLQLKDFSLHYFKGKQKVSKIIDKIKVNIYSPRM